MPSKGDFGLDAGQFANVKSQLAELYRLRPTAMGVDAHKTPAPVALHVLRVNAGLTTS